MSQGPMNKTTAESGPPNAPNDSFKTQPARDSRVKRTGPEWSDGHTQGSRG
jgi:hypothetical protein